MAMLERFLAKIGGERGDAVRRFHEDHVVLTHEAAGSGGNHQAWKGGYRHHLTQCMLLAESVYEWMSSNYFDMAGIDETPFESVIVVLYFHDIEKMWKYSSRGDRTWDNWSKKDFFNNDLPAFGVRLTPAELTALEYIHGEGDDYSKTERKMNRLGAICHAADILSARVLFDKNVREPSLNHDEN